MLYSCIFFEKSETFVLVGERLWINNLFDFFIFFLSVLFHQPSSINQFQSISGYEMIFLGVPVTHMTVVVS